MTEFELLTEINGNIVVVQSILIFFVVIILLKYSYDFFMIFFKTKY